MGTHALAGFYLKSSQVAAHAIGQDIINFIGNSLEVKRFLFAIAFKAD